MHDTERSAELGGALKPLAPTDELVHRFGGAWQWAEGGGWMKFADQDLGRHR